MIVVGLTGGIGSGKSVVAEVLRSMGVAVMDADRLSRIVMAPSGSAYQGIVDVFGHGILSADGRIDRKLLGSVVFADSDKRRTLEGITHPAIAAESVAAIARFAASGHRIVVYEAALLVETGRHRQMQALVVVVADDEVRLERICRRDGISHEEAVARLASQMDQKSKADHADYLIDNTGTLEQTRQQVTELWPRLLGSLGIDQKNEVTR